MMKLIQAQKAAKTNIFPDYWTLLYGRRLSDIMIKTLTGALPLTFTTSETALRSWTIYGNNTPHNYSATGTLPLTFTTHTSGNAENWEIYGNDEPGENLIPSAVNGTYTNGRGTVTCNNGVYTFKISAGTGSVSIIVPIPEFTIPVSVGQGGNGVLYFLNDKATSEIAIPFMYNGSSVMSNYTPLTVNRVINNYGTTETKQCNSIQFFAANSVGDYEITISPMFITDGTAPDHYIPYQQGVGEQRQDGYYVPLTISQAGKPDKTVDIYIGGSPLTEGETVSKASTGVEIELFEGENTISTNLYNKPEMSITGVDYVGLGEPTNDGWQIPLTVSDGTNTTTVNVPIEAPLTDGQTVTDTLTISTFEGENTIDSTIENKPQMSITYKGG